MPTPVSVARQCLTEEAEKALDEAVRVARRRCHTQTTSLHMVSALLSLPSSCLREACGRARNNAYPSRVQFKALELSLSLSLERLPTSPPQRVEEPPISNSLMAAIKRSQAKQRRQLENFNFYHQQQQQQNSSSTSSSLSIVKVELQNLIVSIFDDPVVSRVFVEVGFRSYDIKLAIIEPVHQLLRYSKYKGPPVFLCNSAGESIPNHRAFSFPFLGFPGSSKIDENCRSIGEVLVKKRGRNPLLVGVCANDALKRFMEMVKKRQGVGVLPVELSGLSMSSLENEILSFVYGNCDEGLMKLKFEEVSKAVECCIGAGAVVNLGELKALVGEDASVDAVMYLIHELAKLLDFHNGKVWLIGAAASHETYLKFLNRFPSVGKDWDLQILPITSLRCSLEESHPRSSLMENFVPFDGFFSTPFDIKSQLSNSYNSLPGCNLYNGKYAKESTAFPRSDFNGSVTDHCQSGLPPIVQMTEGGKTDGTCPVQAKDDGMVLTAKFTGFQRKCDSIYQHLHFNQSLCKSDIHHLDYQFPTVSASQNDEERKKNVNDIISCNTKESSDESVCKDINLCSSSSLQEASISKRCCTNAIFLSKLLSNPSKVEKDPFSVRCSSRSLSSSSVHNSGTYATSVTTDLGLGIKSNSTSQKLARPSNDTCADPEYDFSGHLTSTADVFSGSMPDFQFHSSNSRPKLHKEVDQSDFKMLYVGLSKKIDRQESAASVISQTIAHCRTGNDKCHSPRRGNIWFHFFGPDRFAKKKIAIALAEILYGSRENFVCVNLSLQEQISYANSIYDHQDLSGYNLKCRGKTVVDYIAEELSRKPLLVVLLENIDKADPMAQNILSRAAKSGRFSDSFGREVSICNAIFITTTRFIEGSITDSSAKMTAKFSEENITRAKGWPIQISIGLDHGDKPLSHSPRLSDDIRKCDSNLIFMNKRKLICNTEVIVQHGTSDMTKRAHKASSLCLDLNLPAADSEICDASNGNCCYDSISESSSKWLEDFLGQIDERVAFGSVDYDAHADKILEDIGGCFHKIVGFQCLLEIDTKVMEQILAAACVSDNNTVDHWIQQVLSKGFVEAVEKYNLTVHSVVKLTTTCDGLLPEEQEPGVLLPSRIIVE